MYAKKFYRCDMHPHPACVDGEDELDCFDKYIERGFVHKSVDFVCQSPYHNDGQNKTPVIMILSTACDGKTECWQGADEQGCNLNGIQFLICK